ncbi:NAD(P)/FAD-dependent oxidoreductase [Bacillus kexueae]|uniref:NAD(P)/FAD-dependent oxidoreductase n=1 Tax=Aeribacillus kexueae TaxID=2078952 RepID=UPI001FAEA229|nr:NAD(P)/FAD-dependent oxidoreductase [Bacillus kexueae]
MYDCVIIGGGIAGLQAAIQLSRYKYNILVIDSNNGRSSECNMYKNILGWTGGISGMELREAGKKQAIMFGAQFYFGNVIVVKKEDDRFTIQTKDQRKFLSKTILFATGVKDRIPSDLHSMFHPFLGTFIYVCPDCDGYEVYQKRTIVVGSGEAGANMALTLRHWTKDLLYLNHEEQPISLHTKERLKEKGIPMIAEQVIDLKSSKTFCQGVSLKSGKWIETEKIFIAFGGNLVNSSLARQLGVKVNESGHIEVNPRTKETNIKNVWAAGDVVAHSEQVTIAMGDGSQSAIWIHKRLKEMNDL